MEGFEKARAKSLLEHFSEVEDFRAGWRVAHPLPEILLLVVCATIASCDDFDDIAAWGEEHLPFLRRFLPYHHGVPCARWLNIMMNRINPDLFSDIFMAWATHLHGQTAPQIAFDGKTLRRSHDTGKAALHLVSAFATHERLVLGQEATEEKSNEITAIPTGTSATKRSTRILAASCEQTSSSCYANRARPAGLVRAARIGGDSFRTSRQSPNAPKTLKRALFLAIGNGDLIKGKYNRSSVGTLVERTSRYVILVKLENATAPVVHQGFVREMTDVPQTLRKSLTYDRGREMALHKLVAADLNLTVYFADPHAPWQRGSNENTNGLVREYLPKGSDLSVYSQAQLNQIADRLNTRPRKKLGFLSPEEVYSAALNGHTLQTIGALHT